MRHLSLPLRLSLGSAASAAIGLLSLALAGLACSAGEPSGAAGSGGGGGNLGVGGTSGGGGGSSGIGAGGQGSPDAGGPLCPCWENGAADVGYYCESAVRTYAHANGCSVPVLGPADNLLICKIGEGWGLHLACPGGCMVGSGAADDQCDSAPSDGGADGPDGGGGGGASGGAGGGGAGGSGGSGGSSGGTGGGGDGGAGGGGGAPPPPDPCQGIGDGYYCGGIYGFGNDGFLYHCSGGATAGLDDCGSPGCESCPPAVPDRCHLQPGDDVCGCSDCFGVTCCAPNTCYLGLYCG